MENRWSDRDAAECVDRYAKKWGEDLAVRVYSSRLIGREPGLVLHGGGNTSVKGSVTTLMGDRAEAIFVKGSGWDLGSIEPQGFPAVDLAHLRRLRALPALSDEGMLNELRTHLFESSAPNPSVETLLHAFLPHRFVDHTHADVALVVTNQPAEVAPDLIAEAFGPRWGVVPYVMPGFALARRAAEVFEKEPGVIGLVLVGHGLFTFADNAKAAYDRMIVAVDRAERFVREHAKPRTTVALAAGTPSPGVGAARLGPLLRAALSDASGDPDRPWRRVVLEHRYEPDVLEILRRPDAGATAATGPLTPDHVIRTKPTPLFLGDLPWSDDAALRARVTSAVRAFRDGYDAYFQAHRERSAVPLTKLGSSPRVVLVPGVGILASGRTKEDARVAADIAERTLRAKDIAGAIGRYVALGPAELFDVEYWSLEQAKLGKDTHLPLAGQVALVTGGAGAIGFEVCRKVVEAGGYAVVADLDRARIDAAVAELDPKKRGLAAGIELDVTDEDSVASGFAQACALYGGVDLVVPNAGVAQVSSIEATDPDSFWDAAEVNLMGTFLVLREAARTLRRQGTGGNVVVVSTKNVFAPGKDFATYSSSKAGAHQLAKVAALELGEIGVRVNLVNVDAVFGEATRRSGLWEAIAADRARSHGIDVKDLEESYRQRSLLKVRVTGAHVGAAVVFFASNQTPTTGASLPVDGGIPEAFPR